MIEASAINWNCPFCILIAEFSITFPFPRCAFAPRKRVGFCALALIVINKAKANFSILFFMFGIAMI